MMTYVNCSHCFCFLSALPPSPNPLLNNLSSPIPPTNPGTNANIIRTHDSLMGLEEMRRIEKKQQTCQVDGNIIAIGFEGIMF